MSDAAMDHLGTTITQQYSEVLGKLRRMRGKPRPKLPEDCTHAFGIAGGFEGCSACGINPRHFR